MVKRTFLFPVGVSIRGRTRGIGEVNDIIPSSGDDLYKHVDGIIYEKTCTITEIAPAGVTRCSYVRMQNEAFYIPTGSTPIDPKLSVGLAFFDSIKVTVMFNSQKKSNHIVSVFGVNVMIPDQ